MKKAERLIKRLFVELYHWQNDLYGQGNMPGFTALLAISSLQFFNVLSIFIIIENITRIKIAIFFGNNIAISMIIPIGLLIMDYIIVKPISKTINENPPIKIKITWIYVLVTLLLLACCITWIVIQNNKKGI